MWGQVFFDNLKAILPMKSQLRKIYRAIHPYESIPSNDEFAFKQGLRIVGAARRHRSNIDRVLEVGTGWIPTIPHIFHAAGASKIYLTDVEPLMDCRTWEFSREFVAGKATEISSTLGISENLISENLSKEMNYEYLCPFDPSSIPSGSMDIVYSRAVLEHIPPRRLWSLVAQLDRILCRHGVSIHLVDNSDHFEHRIEGLSRVNFLKYPQILWHIACLNPHNYQNRLRHSDYIKLFTEFKYEFMECHGEPDPSALGDLQNLNLSTKFLDYSSSDLAILTSFFVMRKMGDEGKVSRLN